jgi:hypothetical protein
MIHLNDFPDRLSPMLVKELRQGLRARGFTMTFLIFQGLLAFILLFAGSTSDLENAGVFASGVIFSIFATVALVFQPMRGVNALSAEISSNTIEMMVLTRLTARRIVLGKWFAIVSQTALLLTSIIPYLVLRYFFGGMILTGEMVLLALVFLSSMAVTAFMVGASATANRLTRIFPIVGLILGWSVLSTFAFGNRSFNQFISFFTLSDWDSRFAVLGFLALIGYMGWCSLSHGISAIAPNAENHSTARRLVALALSLIMIGVGIFSQLRVEILLVAFAIILAPAVPTAVTEPSFLLPPIYKPFLRFGIAGRIAALFLIPGWPSGVFFTTLLFGLSIPTIMWVSHSGLKGTLLLNDLLPPLAVIGGVLLSALLSVFFSKQERKRFTNFMVFLLILVIFTIIPTIIVNFNDSEDYLWLFVWNPLIFIPMLSEGKFDLSDLLLAACIVDSLILAVLIVKAALAYRGYREVIEETKAEYSGSKLPLLSAAE